MSLRNDLNNMAIIMPGPFQLVVLSLVILVPIAILIAILKLFGKK